MYSLDLIRPPAVVEVGLGNYEKLHRLNAAFTNLRKGRGRVKLQKDDLILFQEDGVPYAFAFMAEARTVHVYPIPLPPVSQFLLNRQDASSLRYAWNTFWLLNEDPVEALELLGYTMRIRTPLIKVMFAMYKRVFGPTHKPESTLMRGALEDFYAGKIDAQALYLAINKIGKDHRSRDDYHALVLDCMMKGVNDEGDMRDFLQILIERVSRADMCDVIRQEIPTGLFVEMLAADLAVRHP